MNSGIEPRAAETLERAGEECSRLLCSSRFDLLRPWYLEGDSKVTAVSVLPRPDPANPGQFQIQIACHAGALRVDWERVPLVLADESGRVLRLGVLDRKGRAILECPFPRQMSFRFLDLDQMPWAAVENFEAALVAASAQLEGESSPSPIQFQALSPDGRLEAKAMLKPGPELQVVVRARDKSLRNAAVLIVMRSKKDKAVLFDARIPLDLEDGMLGDWRTRKDLHKVSEDAEMLIAALRPQIP